jgi:hypothetical protein
MPVLRREQARITKESNFGGLKRLGIGSWKNGKRIKYFKEGFRERDIEFVGGWWV